MLQAFQALEGLLTKNNICIAVKEKLKKDSGVAKEAAYDSIVKRLLSKERAKGRCSQTAVLNSGTQLFMKVHKLHIIIITTHQSSS